MVHPESLESDDPEMNVQLKASAGKKHFESVAAGIAAEADHMMPN